MSNVDVFGKTDSLPAPVLDVMAARLEVRGQHPGFRQMLHEYLDAMAIDTAPTILDLGCGTGVAARAIARRPGASGTVLGIDLSAHLVAVAQRRAEADGVSRQVAFRVGDTRSLDLPDEAFAAVVAHTLLSHVDDPQAVLREAARVVKRGGMVGLFDGDYASLTFSNADPVAGKVYDEAIQQSIVANPRVMRQMPSMLRAAGLELVRVFPSILAEVGSADFWASAIDSFRTLVPQAGVLSAEQFGAWADARLDESAAGVFFGASNYYAYVATRP